MLPSLATFLACPGLAPFPCRLYASLCIADPNHVQAATPSQSATSGMPVIKLASMFLITNWDIGLSRCIGPITFAYQLGFTPCFAAAPVTHLPLTFKPLVIVKTVPYHCLPSQ